jgi:hypothetical protein
MEEGGVGVSFEKPREATALPPVDLFHLHKMAELAIRPNQPAIWQRNGKLGIMGKAKVINNPLLSQHLKSFGAISLKPFSNLQQGVATKLRRGPFLIVYIFQRLISTCTSNLQSTVACDGSLLRPDFFLSKIGTLLLNAIDPTSA